MGIEELSSPLASFSSPSTISSTTSATFTRKNNNITQETDKYVQQSAQDQMSKYMEKKEREKLSSEEAQQIVNGLNEFLKPKYTTLKFKLHEESDRYYVEVIDRDTKEVIREIPEKDLLDMYAKMTELLGLFIDEKL